MKCFKSQSRTDSPTPTNDVFNNQQQQMKPKESHHVPNNCESPQRKPSKSFQNGSFLPSIN